MGRILIVDDDPDFAEALGRILALCGHRTETVSNGWEALIATDASRFDLIILDLMMPGMDGATFLNILRKAANTHAVPVLIVTALSHEDAAPRLKSALVNGVFTKGADLIDDLLAQVNRILGPDLVNDPFLNSN